MIIHRNNKKLQAEYSKWCELYRTVLLTKNINRMRTLKFRIWDDVLKVMYTPELDIEITNLWEIPNFKGGVFEPRDGIKIMQFTGKHDCKGKPIYEGDIIEFDRKEWGGDDNIHTVEWDDYNAEWSWGGGCTGDMDWRTVIGNIWQHDYLLSQKQCCC